MFTRMNHGLGSVLYGMKHNLLQAGIMTSAVLAIWLLTSKNPRARAWGCVAGFAGQPLWFISASPNKEWGIMLLCFWYGFCYIRGFFSNRKLVRST